MFTKGFTPANKGKGRSYQWLRARVGYQEDNCLLWPFAKDGRLGRGTLGYNGKQYKAHRLMCEMVHGPAPAGKPQAAHSCGNGHLGCVNPRHLSWASNSQNQHDRRRHRKDEGAKGSRTRFTPAQVAEIRAKQMTQWALADKFGVSLGCIQYWQGHNRPPAPPSTTRRRAA